jgi:hypothetical protein
MAVKRSKLSALDLSFFKALDRWSPPAGGAANIFVSPVTREELDIKRERFADVIADTVEKTQVGVDPRGEWDHIWGKPVVNRMERASLYYLFTGDDRAIVWAKEALEAMVLCPRPHFTYSTCLGVMDLDLRTAGVVEAVAMMRSVMGHKLDDATLKSMDHIIVERCLKPGLREMRLGKIPWMKSKANWRIILPGMFGLGAMIWHKQVPDWREIVEYGLEGVLVALGTGDSAGGWNEGPGYWEYGLSHAGLFAWTLRAFTGGAVDLFKHPFMQRTGDFRLSMHVKPNEVWNWSDGSKNTGESAFLSQLARVYQNEGYQWLMFREGVKHIYQLYYMDPSLAHDRPPQGKPRTILFPGCGVVVARSGFGEEDTYLGVKAGDIVDLNHHCHMDSGSVVIHAGGSELLAKTEHWGYPREAPKDPKAPRPSRPGLYDEEMKRYKRWDMDIVSAVGHNIPVVEGIYPQAIVGLKPDIQLLKSDENCDIIRVDSSPYYKPVAKKALRTVVFLRPNAAIIVDEIVAPKPVRARLQFHYAKDAVIEKYDLRITNGDAALRVSPLWPDDEANLVIGLDLRRTFYETPGGKNEVGVKYGYVENLWRKKRLVFVTALQFGKSDMKPVTFALQGDATKDTVLKVKVTREAVTETVTFNLESGTVKIKRS